MKFAANENLMDPLILSNQNEEMVERFYSGSQHLPQFSIKTSIPCVTLCTQKKKKRVKITNLNTPCSNFLWIKTFILHSIITRQIIESEINTQANIEFHGHFVPVYTTKSRGANKCHFEL